MSASALPHAIDAVDDTRLEPTVTRCAEIAACLRGAPSERAGEVLSEHGLPPSGWAAMTAACARAIEEERARGEHALVLAYAETFTATRKRLASPAPPPAPVPRPETPARPIDLATFQRVASPHAMSSSRTILLDTVAARRLEGTLDVDARALIGSALPFMSRSAPADPFDASSAPADAPDAMLSRHASLCAELSASPARKEDVLAKHGLTPGSFDSLDADCQRRMAGDPGLSRRWQALYTRYQAWFGAIGATGSAAAGGGKR